MGGTAPSAADGDATVLYFANPYELGHGWREAVRGVALLLDGLQPALRSSKRRGLVQRALALLL